MQPQKITFGEKLGFSLGDGAANLVFQTIMLLQLSFYTDTFGLTAGSAAVLFLVARLWGAVMDPIAGTLSDRTNTRWGKFRPWILWTSVPFGIIGFLAFTTPNFDMTGKLIYAYVTYFLLLTIYSANNVPYSALFGVLTGDMKERTSVSSIKSLMVVLATLAIQGLALPMVNHFGHGDSAKGYQITMGIFSAIAVLFFIITFSTTKERIKSDPKQKSSLKQDIKDLLQNRPWVIVFTIFIFMFIFLGIRNSILLYYFNYYLGIAHQKAFLLKLDNVFLGLIGTLGMTSETADIAGNTFSIMNILSQLAAILGLIFSKPLAARYGKRNTLRTWFIIAGIFSAAFIFIPPHGVGLAFVLSLLFNFSWGVTMPLPWAMLADVADFSEWKNNRRATGIIFAGIMIGLKVGLAIGGALAGYFLSAFGYVAKAIQTPQSLLGIRLSLSIFPAIMLFICVVLLFIYQINKKMEYQMQDELIERRKSYEQ